MIAEPQVAHARGGMNGFMAGAILGGAMRGLEFIPTRFGLDVKTTGPTGSGQGHQDQFIAEMGQWDMPIDQQFIVYGKDYTFRDFVDKGFVIAGGPATVRDMLTEAIKDLRVGNLMVLLHIGSMPHELTLKNIDLFSREVLPHVRDIWDNEWENHWWPETLRAKRTLPIEAVPAGGAS